MKIKLDGNDYELVMPDDLTMGEQREFEKIAEHGIDWIEKLGDDWRASVVVAWMAVSIQREKPTTPMTQIVQRLNELKAKDLQEAWADVVKQDPPTSRPASSSADDESEQPTSSDLSTVSEIVPVREIPPGTGDPGLATGAPSGPVRWEGSDLGSSRAAGSS